MFILYVHDALMALGFQSSLLVIVSEKYLPLFSLQSICEMVMLVPQAKVTTSNSII